MYFFDKSHVWEKRLRMTLRVREVIIVIKRLNDVGDDEVDDDDVGDDQVDEQ